MCPVAKLSGVALHNLRQTDSHDRSDALRISRFVWAGVLLSQVIGVLTACVILAQARSSPSPSQGWLAFHMGLFVAVVSAGYFVRGQIYKRHWRGHLITPRGYLGGNVMLWVCCEGLVAAGIVHIFVSGSFWPAGGPTTMAIVVQLINYPNGQAMEPAVSG